jgi:DNA adenine methylase
MNEQLGNTLRKVDPIDRVECKPFLKWAGGKRQLLPELLSRFPEKFNYYHEPFIGGGALFFSVQPGFGTISDINSELINCYRVVRENPRELIEELSHYEISEKFFYEIRNADREAGFAEWTPLKRAARIIYLNKNCFNGLYRVNSKGLFNVPFGKYENPQLADLDNLLACSYVLQQVEILCGSYLDVERRCSNGDFVYFDPPYAPLSATSNFTNYSNDGFSSDDQLALAELCRRLDRNGVLFMLSNSDVPEVRDLYEPNFKVETVQAGRAVNSVGSKRGKVSEVLVRNY